MNKKRKERKKLKKSERINVLNTIGNVGPPASRDTFRYRPNMHFPGAQAPRRGLSRRPAKRVAEKKIKNCPQKKKVWRAYKTMAGIDCRKRQKQKAREARRNTGEHYAGKKKIAEIKIK